MSKKKLATSPPMVLEIYPIPHPKVRKYIFLHKSADKAPLAIPPTIWFDFDYQNWLFEVVDCNKYMLWYESTFVGKKHLRIEVFKHTLWFKHTVDPRMVAESASQPICMFSCVNPLMQRGGLAYFRFSRAKNFDFQKINCLNACNTLVTYILCCGRKVRSWTKKVS